MSRVLTVAFLLLLPAVLEAQTCMIAVPVTCESLAGPNAADPCADKYCVVDVPIGGGLYAHICEGQPLEQGTEVYNKTVDILFPALTTESGYTNWALASAVDCLDGFYCTCESDFHRLIPGAHCGRGAKSHEGPDYLNSVPAGGACVGTQQPPGGGGCAGD